MNTHPICNSPLYRSARRSFAPLQILRRKEISVLMCEQKPCPVWFSRRRKSYLLKKALKSVFKLRGNKKQNLTS